MGWFCYHDQLVGDADLDEPVYEELGRRDQSMLASAGPGARLVVQVEAHRFGPAVGVGPLELLEVLALGALSDLTPVDLAERQVRVGRDKNRPVMAVLYRVPWRARAACRRSPSLFCRPGQRCWPSDDNAPDCVAMELACDPH